MPENVTPLRAGRAEPGRIPPPRLVRVHPQPPALPEPPLLCRLGWHRLTVVSVGAPWPAGAVQLASVTAMCRRDRCALLRHEQHRIVPRTTAQLLRGLAHAARVRLAAR